MAVNLSPVGGVAAQFFDNSGNPLTGGKLYTYAAGTTTPAATYTSSSGVTAHPNPIVLDAAGRVPNSGEVWLTDGSQYKFVLKTSTDVLIATYDNIVGINSNFVNFTNEQEIQTATAGQTVFTLTTMQYQPGTNSLSVFVDGVNQYGPGAQYAFLETDSTTVTFISGLHVGAEVKFTTSAINASSYGDASQVSFTGFKGQVGNVQDLADSDGSDWIGFESTKTGAVARSVQDKLLDVVSVLDFMPAQQAAYIIANNEAAQNATLVTAAINAAIAASNVVYFPIGTYMINDTIGDSGTNPIARTIYGEDQQKTIIKSVASWTSSGMVWFGNSSGYGAQYCTIRNMTIDGNDKANNHSGIVYQSAGLSLVQNVTIQNCGRAAWMHGCIDTAMIDCNIFNCFEGAIWDKYPIGTPSGPRDMTVQATQNTNANISRMYGCWISGCEANAVYISGGNFLLDACTFQSATNNSLYNIVHVVDSNESYNYGGGPIIQNCWQEGGDYKYFIYVEGTRQTRIFNNHINGDFGAGTNVEGAIFLDALSVRNVSIKNNSIRGNYSATPTGGRLANAAIYVTNGDTYTCDIENNYITTNTVNVYWAGLTSPTVDRRLLALFGCVSIAAGVGTVTFESMKFILSVTKNGTGDFTVEYTFNRQPLASGFYPVTVTPHTTGGGVTYSVSHFASTTNADRFIFNDDSGAAADPAGFSIQLLGGGWQQV